MSQNSRGIVRMVGQHDSARHTLLTYLRLDITLFIVVSFWGTVCPPDRFESIPHTQEEGVDPRWPMQAAGFVNDTQYNNSTNVHSSYVHIPPPLSSGAFEQS